MAILAIFHGKGFTKDQYESLRSVVRWETDKPDGAIFHTCWFDEHSDLHVGEMCGSRKRR